MTTPPVPTELLKFLVYVDVDSDSGWYTKGFPVHSYSADGAVRSAVLTAMDANLNARIIGVVEVDA